MSHWTITDIQFEFHKVLHCQTYISLRPSWNMTVNGVGRRGRMMKKRMGKERKGRRGWGIRGWQGTGWGRSRWGIRGWRGKRRTGWGKRVWGRGGVSEFTGLHGGMKSTYVLLVGNLPHWEKRLYFHSNTPYIGIRKGHNISKNYGPSLYHSIKDISLEQCQPIPTLIYTIHQELIRGLVEFITIVVHKF